MNLLVLDCLTGCVCVYGKGHSYAQPVVLKVKTHFNDWDLVKLGGVLIDFKLQGGK